MSGFLTSKGEKTAENLEQYLDGNLCRCTGYRPILESFRKLLTDPSVTSSSDSCKKTNDSSSCSTTNCGCSKTSDATVTANGDTTDYSKCSGQCSSCACKSTCTKEHPPGQLSDIEDLIMLPSASSESRAHSSSTSPPSPPNEILHFHAASKSSRQQLFSPTTLPQAQNLLLDLVADNCKSDISIVAGHTGSGVSKYYNNTAPKNHAIETPIMVDVSNINELKAITFDGSAFTFFAGVTLARLIDAMKSQTKSTALQAAAKHISMVANTQVRSAGTWAGNIMMATK